MEYNCASESLSTILDVSIELPLTNWVVVGYPDIIQIAAETMEKGDATQSYQRSMVCNRPGFNEEHKIQVV